MMYNWLRGSLPNGLRVVTVELPHLHAAMVSLYVMAGSRHDPTKQSGLSHFLEHIFFRGCETYPNSKILNSSIELAGGSLNGVTTRDHGYYYTLAHPEGISKLLEILGQMISKPLMLDIEMEREVILEEILDEVDEQGRLIDVDTISKKLAFGSHPLAMPIAGHTESVRAIFEDDLRSHHSRYYCPNNLVLAVAGPVKHSNILAKAEDAFGFMKPSPLESAVSPMPLPTGPHLEYVRHRESQTSLRMTFPGLTESHPDYSAQMILSRILDDGLASRLQQEIVERRGLAYAISAGVDVMADTALFEIDACTAHAKVPELIRTIEQTLGELASTPPDQEELRRTKLRHRYDIDFMQDSVCDLTGWFGVGELHQCACTLESRIEKVASLTPEDINRVARTVFRPELMLAVVVGLSNEKETRTAIESRW